MNWLERLKILIGAWVFRDFIDLNAAAPKYFTQYMHLTLLRRDLILNDYSNFL